MNTGVAPKWLAHFARTGARLWLSMALVLAWLNPARANPYLAKPGERAVTVRIATCAVSGGFAHLYTALDNNLFEKYGFKMEHVFIRGSGSSLAALAADEIQFLYCAADATLPSPAARLDVQLLPPPSTKLPYLLLPRPATHPPAPFTAPSPPLAPPP